MTTEPVDLEVTLHLGSRSHRFPLVALAATLHLPREPLRQALLGLLLAYLREDGEEAHEGEPTEGESARRTLETFETLPDVHTQKTLETSEGEGVQGEGDRAVQHLTAAFLAGALHDEDHLPALEHLVAQCAPEVLKAALDETLALPDARIRVSRGAYFTAAVRRRGRCQQPPAHS